MAAKILVVDDDPNVQRLLQYTLKQEGYDVVIAADGAEGFRLWGAEAPDLILLDVMLPKLDGYQVAAKIRSEEGGSAHVPIIMLTAEREVEQKVRGLRVSKVELPDVKAIRLSLRMSQNHFAAAYRIPLPTLKNWEQGRRLPDAPAAAYLLAIKRRPKEIMEAVARP